MASWCMLIKAIFNYTITKWKWISLQSLFFVSPVKARRLHLMLSFFHILIFTQIRKCFRGIVYVEMSETKRRKQTEVFIKFVRHVPKPFASFKFSFQDGFQDFEDVGIQISWESLFYLQFPKWRLSDFTVNMHTCGAPTATTKSHPLVIIQHKQKKKMELILWTPSF